MSDGGLEARLDPADTEGVPAEEPRQNPEAGVEAGRQMDSAIRSRTGRSAPAKKKRQTSGAPSVGDDLDAATAAIRAGDHARAVNLLNRAMRNAKGPTRARIKKQRDELARKIMGR